MPNHCAATTVHRQGRMQAPALHLLRRPPHVLPEGIREPPAAAPFAAFIQHQPVLLCTANRCRYETAKRKGDYDDEARKRENAKQSLERYMHYFERWDAHQKARNKVR